MKVRTLGRMFILKHSILALERAPNMYRTPSTSGEPLPAVRELSANCIAYVSAYIYTMVYTYKSHCPNTTFTTATD